MVSVASLSPSQWGLAIRRRLQFDVLQTCQKMVKDRLREIAPTARCNREAGSRNLTFTFLGHVCVVWPNHKPKMKPISEEDLRTRTEWCVAWRLKAYTVHVLSSTQDPDRFSNSNRIRFHGRCKVSPPLLIHPRPVQRSKSTILFRGSVQALLSVFHCARLGWDSMARR